MGAVYYDSANFEEACKCFERTLTLARELGEKGETDEKGVAFAVVIDKYNRITLLKTHNGKLKGTESVDARSQRYPSVTDSPHPTGPNSYVKILTPEAEKELGKIGLKNVQKVFVSYSQSQQFVSDESCQCPWYGKVKLGGINTCVDVECDVEDEWLF